MTEREWQSQVCRLLDLYRWGWYHTHRSDRSRPGYPDLTAWHPDHGVIWAELKTATGKPTPDQTRVIAELRAAGARVYIWRPSDADEVARILRGAR